MCVLIHQQRSHHTRSETSPIHGPPSQETGQLKDRVEGVYLKDEDISDLLVGTRVSFFFNPVKLSQVHDARTALGKALPTSLVFWQASKPFCDDRQR